MGPPEKQPREGRHNAAGQVTLYLCDSEEGVRRELSPQGGERLFLQEYVLTFDSLRLADFSAPGLNEFVGAVFDMAENSSVAGRIGRSDYAFSQLVADLVREEESQGMLVPGVRGDRDFKYLNVVVFDPPAAERWRTWSRKDEGFRSVVG